MAVQMSELLAIQRGSLRYEPTRKRVRAQLGDDTVVDSDRAVLVWEPRRVVPGYAVPAVDIAADIVDPPAPGTDDEHNPATDAPDTSDYYRIPYWDPRTPFAVRETPGRPMLLRAPGRRPVEAFLPEDPDLAGMVILDFLGFDTWLEDDDVVVSHPHDPFARIDIRGSGKRTTISLDGEVVADSTRARLLYETGLPERYYLPPEDVRVELQPSATRTTCSYKGTATYFSPVVRGVPVQDFAWSYPEPLVDALGVTDRICFFHERMDLSIDGIEQPRPWTPWS
ncbi:DUF427 domain-containing protein [Microbacteriaceae bacterium 4G12]